MNPLAILCKGCQKDELCVMHAIECMFKVKQSVEKMKTASFEKLPTVKKVLERAQQDNLDSTSVVYQSTEIKGMSRLKST